MSQIKILIADDRELQRDVAQCSLAQNASEKNEKHLKNIKNIFEIRRYHMVGMALQEIAGFQPDLALVDVCFDELAPHDIEESGYSVDLEAIKTRGLDLIAALKEQCPQCQSILFSAYTGDNDIYEELTNRGYRNAQNFLPLHGKDVALRQMSEITQGYLRQVIDQLITTIDLEHFERQFRQYRPDQIEQLLNIVVRTERGNYLVRHLFVHLAYFDGDEIKYRNLHEELNKVLEPVPEEEAPIEEVFNYENWPNPEFNGLWKQEFIQTALIAYKQDQEYTNNRNRLDINAANYVLCAFFAHRNNLRHFLPNLEFNPLGQFNIGKNQRYYTDPGWKGIFHNALTMRRILLMWSELARHNEEVYLNGNACSMPFTTFFPICRITERLAQNNLRQYISQLWGLSKQTAEDERLNTTGFIMLEEQQFLNNYLQKIADKILRGDYTLFE